MSAQPLQITRVHLLEYPQRGTRSATLIRIHGAGSPEAPELTGAGMAVPAQGVDADPAGPAWAFLHAAAEGLRSSRIPADDGPTWLHEQMSQLADLAAARAVEENRRKPFRACLAGLEQALIGLLAEAGHEITPAAMEGTPSAREAQPVPAAGTYDQDLELLAAADSAQPVWLDFDGAYRRNEATRFVEAVAQLMNQGGLPDMVILEQLVPRRYGDHLPVLQQLADEQVTGGGLRIMASHSCWDVADLRRLQRNGGCRALRIDPMRAGGTLQATELAAAATQAGADVFVHVDGPPEPPDYHGLVSSARQFVWIPEPEPAPEVAQAQPNLYDVRFYDRFRTPELDNHLISREALAYGLNIERTSTLDFEAVDDTGLRLRFWWSTAQDTTFGARQICRDKQVARMLMARQGVPVPQGRSFPAGDYGAGLAYADELGYPVVLKPTSGTGGDGVVADIRSADDLRWAFDQFEQAPGGSGSFIIEQHIHGNDYRIFVLEGRVLSVAQRTPASVIGDGQRTVAELVLDKNAVRRQNPHLMAHPIRLNAMASRELARQDLHADAVPAAGRRVQLTAVANLAQGGDNIEVMHETHPSVLEAAAAGLNAIPGLTQGGVDFLIADHRLPVDEQVCGICEINYGPAQTANETTLYGDPAPISEEMIRHFGAKHGMAMRPERHGQVTVTATFIGSRRPARLAARITSDATAMGLTGWVRPGGRRRREALLSGPVDHVSALLNRAFLFHGRASPELVKTVHTTEPPPQAFTNAEDEPDARTQGEAA